MRSASLKLWCGWTENFPQSHTVYSVPGSKTLAKESSECCNAVIKMEAEDVG